MSTPREHIEQLQQLVQLHGPQVWQRSEMQCLAIFALKTHLDEFAEALCNDSAEDEIRAKAENLVEQLRSWPITKSPIVVHEERLEAADLIQHLAHLRENLKSPFCNAHGRRHKKLSK